MACFRLVFCLFGLFYLLAPSSAQAEPWLSTRFSQNCSGCHAPGRRNLEPSARRCTLSCQGCHINPNGGGVRNPYGKWTENHWLKSMSIAAFKQTKTTAPLAKQKYSFSVRDYKAGKAKSRMKGSLKAHPEGQKLVLSATEPVNEDLYDRAHDPYYDKLGNTSSMIEKMHVIPDGDPHRQMLESKVDGGADLRLAVLKRDTGDSELDKPKTFAMSLDFGLRWRPIYKKVHVVYEGRFLGGPETNSTDEIADAPIPIRSLYVMVDDLPYNVFVMGGYYRPLFGNYVADHYALSQVMLSQVLGAGAAYNILYKAVSVGTAPNVPYLNLHLIGKNMASADVASNKHQGYAANLGLRFVSFGASINYSFWSSEDKTDADYPVKIVMHSLNLKGALFKKWVIFALEAISFERDDLRNDFRQGGIYSLNTKFKLWRETYATLDYATANTSESLLPGSAAQMKYGLRAFLFPGFDSSLQYSVDDYQTDGAVSNKRKSYLAMFHLYY